MAAFKKTLTDVNSEPNVVPMADIMLVLLIIFMVITPLVPKGLDALVPQPNPNQPDQQVDPDIRTVVVSVNQNGALLINQDPVTKAELGARLDDIFRTRADRTMFVRGDPEVLFFEVAEVIDIAKGVQIDKIGLITANIEAGQ